MARRHPLKKPKKDRVTERIESLVTEQEKRRIAAAAKAESQTVSAWARQVMVEAAG